MAADYKLPPSRPVTAECADLLSRILTRVNRGLRLLELTILDGLIPASRSSWGLDLAFLSIYWSLAQRREAIFCSRGLDICHARTLEYTAAAAPVT